MYHIWGNTSGRTLANGHTKKASPQILFRSYGVCFSHSQLQKGSLLLLLRHLLDSAACWSPSHHLLQYLHRCVVASVGKDSKSYLGIINWLVLRSPNPDVNFPRVRRCLDQEFWLRLTCMRNSRSPLLATEEKETQFWRKKWHGSEARWVIKQSGLLTGKEEWLGRQEAIKSCTQSLYHCCLTVISRNTFIRKRSSRLRLHELFWTENTESLALYLRTVSVWNCWEPLFKLEIPF